MIKSPIKLLLIIPIIILCSCTNSNSSIYDKYIDCFVEIKSVTKTGTMYGTGCLYNNHIITVSHVVSYTYLSEKIDCDEVYYRFYNTEEYVSTTILKNDYSNDIAILGSLENSYSLQPSYTYSTGEEVNCFGNSTNCGISLKYGSISLKSVNVSYGGITRSVIQVNASLVNGDSGGGIINKNGNLIAIISFRLNDSYGNAIPNLVYCIPISDYDLLIS